ncbi:histidine phosphatase family protein [Mycolicibacterium neoaurum]|uniref:histidine phosphatase family protein n=1 Tax=Mycolicibacterium neoaurum TaxID=1795 RepID=UPI001BCE6BF2|nr:histidine phosphatase family protein [Mycolicibacterium neoaurum]
MKNLILVRHGETVFNKKGIIPGSKDDPGLSAYGRASCSRLRGLLDDVLCADRAVILSSPSRRAMETAYLGCTPGSFISVDRNLREVSVGRNSIRDPLFSEWHTTLIEDWCRGERLHVSPVGGESGAEVVNRIESVRQRIIASQAATVVVFSHFALIKVWLSLLVESTDGIARHRPALLDACVVRGAGAVAIEWYEHPGDPRQPDNTHRH